MDGVFNYMEIVVEDKLNKLIDENNVCENCKKSIQETCNDYSE